MRKLILVVFVIILLVGCSDKATPKTDPNAKPTDDKAVASGDVEQIANQLQLTEPTPLQPLDQSSPQVAMENFFVAVNIALDPMFQLAFKNEGSDPHRAAAYEDALSKLRKLFVNQQARFEVVAYLDIIKIQQAEVLGKPKIKDDTATLQLRIVKGDNLEFDPKSFNEGDKKELEVEVKMVKKEDAWKIEDFGGLVAKAKNALP